MLISLMSRLVKMLKFLLALSLLWRSRFAPDWDGPRSGDSIPMGLAHWAAKSVSRTDWVTISQEVSANLAFPSDWCSQPHQRRSARRGDYRYLAWFFPFNTHSVNVKISHSIGGTVPVRRLCATLDIWPNATSFSHWPDAGAITLHAYATGCKFGRHDIENHVAM